MSDPLPPTSPGPDPVPADSPEAAAVAKRKWPLSRTILLAILAICLAALGFDYFAGRRPQQDAYQMLRSKLPNETKAEGGPVITVDKLLAPDEVHKLLGRTPDIVEENPERAFRLMQEHDAEGAQGLRPAMVEVYRYPGALQNYVVRVAYRKEPGGKVGSYQMADLSTNTQSRFSD